MPLNNPKFNFVKLSGILFLIFCGAILWLNASAYEFIIDNPLNSGANTVGELLKIIVSWIFRLAIPIAVAVIVYSGILFLTSKGNPAQVTKARQMLQYAVIGLAIILVGSGFISLIRSILELGAGPTTEAKYTCNPAGECIEDSGGGYTSYDSCIAGCRPH